MTYSTVADPRGSATDTVPVTMARILIVEDNPDLAYGLRTGLEIEGYEVQVAEDGEKGLDRARTWNPDLVMLDLMLPGMDGLEICRQVRRHDRYAGIPILMLTARSGEADRVVGLELGADDYVTKPFSMRELVARIRALLRRHEAIPQRNSVQRGDLVIDPSAHAVRVAGKQVELSALEFRLLHHLASHPGLVFSRDQLLDRVWGNDRSVTPRSVDVYIRRVREKIESEPQQPAYLQTVHGVGYRFVAGME